VFVGLFARNHFACWCVLVGHPFILRNPAQEVTLQFQILW
jgi:hypothetical protein